MLETSLGSYLQSLSTSLGFYSQPDTPDLAWERTDPYWGNPLAGCAVCTMCAVLG